jgi:hypothetical protein
MTRANLFVAVKEICNAAGGHVSEVVMQVADAEMNRLIVAAVAEFQERAAQIPEHTAAQLIAHAEADPLAAKYSQTILEAKRSAAAELKDVALLIRELELT